MKILLVDDEDRSLRQTGGLIHSAAPGALITESRSRDEAISALSEDEFDLIICDLRMPPHEDSADIREEHGHAVHALARQICPGTPIIFLTAFSTNVNLRGQLSSGGVGRIFGLPAVPMVQLVTKTEREEFKETVRELDSALRSLHLNISLDCSSVLDEMFDRGARAYARELGYEAVEVAGFSGLSGAKVGQLTMRDEDRSPVAVFMKVAPFEDARDEHDRFVNLVANRLQPGAFAGSLPPMNTGLRKQTALFSTLANSRHISLFKVLEQRREQAVDVVGHLRESLQPFETKNPPIATTLGDLRREAISDAKLSEHLSSADDFMANELQVVDVRRYLAHADLHGENILVDDSGRPILIDFGDVGIRSACLDPLTLELSVLFHLDGPARNTAWHAQADWSAWADLDSFANNSPFEDFIRACREWALERDAPQALFATAYAHALRQVKFPDVDNEIALAIAESARRKLA